MAVTFLNPSVLRIDFVPEFIWLTADVSSAVLEPMMTRSPITVQLGTIWAIASGITIQVYTVLPSWTCELTWSIPPLFSAANFPSAVSDSSNSFASFSLAIITNPP